MVNPNRPYRKINLLSRKEKDKRNIESAKLAPYGGDVIVKSKNKITNPVNKAQMLPRGSQVSFRNINETTQKPDITIPEKKYTTSKTIPASSEYIPGEVNPPGKPIIDRPTTMELGRKLKESPSKTMTRMQAQKDEKTSYDYKGKKEYSGRFKTTPSQTIKSEKTIPALTVKGESYTIPKKQVITKNYPIPNDIGSPASKTYRHVRWLSNKKETGGLTSKPNTGGKTTVIWKRNKIKRK